MGKLIIDTDSIKSFNIDIKTKSDEIMNIFLDVEKDLKDIEEIFNSRAGAIYREKLSSYINYVKDKVSSENESLTTKINAIIKIYEELGEDIEKMVS